MRSPERRKTGFGAVCAALAASLLWAEDVPAGAPPTFSKTFEPDSILVGETSTLVFEIGNFTTIAANQLTFTDDLPAGLAVASPANASLTCTGGTLTAVAGTGTISYSGGSLLQLSSCNVRVDVEALFEGFHVNVTGDLTSTLGNSGSATDTLVAPEPAGSLPAFAVLVALAHRARHRTRAR